MVLISLHPFAFKKILLLVATIVCVSSAICFGDPLFMTLHSKGQDQQLNRVQAMSIPTPTHPPGQVVYRSDGGYAENSGRILSSPFSVAREWEWTTDCLVDQ
jgi:hypothetical protein